MLFSPPICAVCQGRIITPAASMGRPGIYRSVCPDCFASIPLRRGLVHGSEFSFVLGAATDYENPVAQSLIHALKFRGIRSAAAPLGDLLYDYVSAKGVATAAGSPPFDLDRLAAENFLVVPIPLSRRRERTRGYNQAELIARRLAARTGLLVEPGLLARTRHTSPQSDIANVAARRQNLRGAFVATSAAREKNILLVDDVATTGATLGEAVRALEAAGTVRIVALAVAKT